MWLEPSVICLQTEAGCSQGSCQGSLLVSLSTDIQKNGEQIYSRIKVADENEKLATAWNLPKKKEENLKFV